jgi:hypothetical protein
MRSWAQQEAVPSFTKIQIEDPVSIILIKSNECKIDKGMYKSLVCNVENGVLEFELSSIPKINDKIKVYYQSLELITIKGIGSIETAENEALVTESFTLKSEGVSKVNLQLNVRLFKLTSEGAGKITLKGNADVFNANLEGAVILEAREFSTNNTTIEASGAGSFSAKAASQINIVADGIVKGEYFGNPPITNIKVRGLSKIVNAQNGQEFSDSRNSNTTDTTKVKIGKRKFIITPEYEEVKNDNKGRKEFKNVFGGYELGLQALTINGFNTNMPANYRFLQTNVSRSWHHAIYFWEDDIHIIKNKVSLASSVGLEFGHIGFDDNRKLQANQQTISVDSNTQALLRNRLTNLGLNIPLLIKYAPGTAKGRNKGFHIAAGVIGTYVMSSILYARSTALGYKQEWTITDDFNVNPFRATATLRMGYGSLRLFANYNLTPYFKRTNTDVNGGIAPDFRVATIGLTLISF